MYRPAQASEPPTSERFWRASIARALKPLGKDFVLEKAALLAHGASPDLIATALPFGPSEARPRVAIAAPRVPPPFPELHILDNEWYFSATSAWRTAQLIIQSGPNVLCIGTPTVADHIARLGLKPLLVDSAPYLRQRFGRLSLSDLEVGRIEDVLHIPRSFDAAVLDPPWYLTTMRRWLAIASRSVRPGGHIAISLFRGLTRPAAKAERQEILDFARTIGDIAVLPAWFEYDTPLFEQRALAALIPDIPRFWRRSDMLLITKRRQSALLVPDEPQEDQWKSFLIGTQVIKLRSRATARRGRAIRPVPGVTDWVLDSVSARDPRRSAVGLWTSRNRVGRISDPLIIQRILEELQRVGRESAHRELMSIASDEGLPTSVGDDLAALLDFV
jgi:SAM-dependent methyltransferase